MPLASRWLSQPLLAVLLLIAGCSSTPTAPPEVGETPAQIINRMYEVHVEYQMVTGGHRYTVARAVSKDGEYHHLVFIDGALACSRVPGVYSSIEDFRADVTSDLRDYTVWEWAAESDGLDYLASRVRVACELEPATPPRQPPVGEILSMPETEIGGPPSTAQEIGGMLLGSLLMTAFIVYGPLFAIGAGGHEAYLNSAFKSGSERALLVALPQPEDAVREVLGAPDARFVLPKANTTVLAYDPKSERSWYVGIREGQAVWVHGEYPWLDRLAEKAAKETDAPDQR